MTRAGFETGFISLSDRFYRVAFYLLEDREKALDAVQDLFLKLWKMRATIGNAALTLSGATFWKRKFRKKRLSTPGRT